MNSQNYLCSFCKKTCYFFLLMYSQILIVEVCKILWTKQQEELEWPLFCFELVWPYEDSLEWLLLFLLTILFADSIVDYLLDEFFS